MVHLGKHLMEMQLDSDGGAILRDCDGEAGRYCPSQEIHDARCSGEDCVTGLAFKDGTTLDCDMVVVAAGIRPNAEIGVRAGLTVERAIVVDNHMRSVDDFERLCRRRVRAAPRPGLRPGGAAVGAGEGVRRPHHRRRYDAAYHGSKLATKLKVMGVELASMGINEPGRGRRRNGPVHRADAGASTRN